MVAVATRCATTGYAEEVVAGRIKTGRPVRLAAERHLRDLERGKERGLRFDAKAADRAISFFPKILRLADGVHAGQAFQLQPFQSFLVGSLFGWKGDDGYRRFRTSYIEQAKGNGKTPTAAGIGLYGLASDGEAGAEVYAAAVTRAQAGILFRDALRMVEASDALKSRLDVNVANIAHLPSGSFFRPVSSEARNLDGLRVHMALIDEVHEHRDAEVIDKLRAGTKGRRQALILEITNSGYDRNSVCWQHHDYSLKVLDGLIEDDSWFSYVCALDDGDDWQDESVWIKANPNLGVSITHRYLAEQVREAVGMPAKANIVKRLNFCLWTESFAQWLPLDKWDEGGREPIDPAALAGRPCYAGLDMSSVSDITALVLAFPAPDGTIDVLPFFWVPGESIAKRAREDRVPYDVWERQGYVFRTEGNAVDQEAIVAQIRELGARYQIREVAADIWNAGYVIEQLNKNRPKDKPLAFAFSQGIAAMTGPSKELERRVLEGRIRHGGNPVLRWMVSNTAVAQDAAGNIKPAKNRSTERIDGVIALVMSLGRASLGGGGGSVYESRGLAGVG